MSDYKLSERLLDILFPRRLVCASCGREAQVGEGGLCADCAAGIEPFNAAPVIPGVEGYTAAYVYNDVSGSMIKRLKYSGMRWIARELADAIELPEGWSIDAVVPVPLYKSRLRQRGFNQSELIAKHLCSRTHLTLDCGLLKRVMDTDSQTHRTAASRRSALKKAFLADEACRGKRLLLVDDVRTTGSTLAECAAELRRRGAAAVYAVTACFAKDG